MKGAHISDEAGAMLEMLVREWEALARRLIPSKTDDGVCLKHRWSTVAFTTKASLDAATPTIVDGAIDRADGAPTAPKGHCVACPYR